VTVRVLGVDGCRTGWVGVVLEGGRLTAVHGANITDLLDAAGRDGGLACVAVDMPIGLPDTGRRQADVLARKALGPRWQSIFLTPVRPALRTADFAEAVALNRELAGEGLSRQAFALRSKVLEVDAFVRDGAVPVIEVHPELSFATMAGGPLSAGKKTWTGAQERRGLLARHGIPVPDDLGPAGALAAVDDLLDAAAAAWSASRYAAGLARSLPSPPERFSDEIPCAIWT
jgi:predicted RNase H-like nuclease